MQTDRLVLRPRSADDAAIYRRLWEERDRRVPPHRRIDADGRPTVEDIAAQIRTEPPGLFAVQLKDTSEVIGYCGLRFDEHEPELAYELLRSSHGRGYATEAGRAVVAWADETGYPRLRATVSEWNAASRRVLAKLGFREVAADGDNVLAVRESPG